MHRHMALSPERSSARSPGPSGGGGGEPCEPGVGVSYFSLLRTTSNGFGLWRMSRSATLP
jgi:hypothetical protein